MATTEDAISLDGSSEVLWISQFLSRYSDSLRGSMVNSSQSKGQTQVLRPNAEVPPSKRPVIFNADWGEIFFLRLT